MKLRNKLAIITASAMLAFAGAGYAAWTFTAQREAEISTIQDKVAVGIELNDDFKLYNADDDAEVTGLYLICDAPTVGVAGKYLAGSGIYWATDAAGANAIDDVYLKGTVTKDMEDSVKDKTSVTVQFTGNNNFGSQSYVDFGAMTISNKVVSGLNATDDFDVQSDDFDLPAVSYVAANIPETIAELTAMNSALGTALSGKKLSFTAQIIA